MERMGSSRENKEVQRGAFKFTFKKTTILVEEQAKKVNEMVVENKKEREKRFLQEEIRKEVDGTEKERKAESRSREGTTNGSGGGFLRP